MTDDDEQYPKHSPLSRTVTRDGETVYVEIFEDGEGGWLLEVVDEYGNSTVWDLPFESDSEALEEAIRTIEEEGIAALTGLPDDSEALQRQADPHPMNGGLSDEELEELDLFLMSEAVSDETMMLDDLDGFLTAVVSGPLMPNPAVWLPRVWGSSVRDEPRFDSRAQAERIVGLIFRHLNGIVWSMQQDPDGFEPLFDMLVYPDDPREYADGEMWASGYMIGIELQRDNWNAFFDEPACVEALRPIYLLGAGDVEPEEEALTETPAQRDELSAQIAASAAWIYKFWQPYRQAEEERAIAARYQREYPKVGRNDPCPCGSGKKFKKCCGVPTLLH